MEPQSHVESVVHDGIRLLHSMTIQWEARLLHRLEKERIFVLDPDEFKTTLNFLVRLSTCIRYSIEQLRAPLSMVSLSMCSPLRSSRVKSPPISFSHEDGACGELTDGTVGCHNGHPTETGDGAHMRLESLLHEINESLHLLPKSLSSIIKKEQQRKEDIVLEELEESSEHSALSTLLNKINELNPTFSFPSILHPWHRIASYLPGSFLLRSFSLVCKAFLQIAHSPSCPIHLPSVKKGCIRTNVLWDLFLWDYSIQSIPVERNILQLFFAYAIFPSLSSVNITLGNNGVFKGKTYSVFHEAFLQAVFLLQDINVKLCIRDAHLTANCGIDFRRLQEFSMYKATANPILWNELREIASKTGDESFSLEIIHFEECDLREGLFKTLLLVAAKSPCLRQLTFHGCRLDRSDVSVENFSPLFQQNRSYFALDMTFTALGGKFYRIMSEAIDSAECRLTELNLSHASTSGFDLEKTMELFKKIPHLRSINIAYNDMLDWEVEWIIMALESCKSLQRLDVGGNMFGKKFLSALLKSMSKKHFVLTHLNLTEANFETEALWERFGKMIASPKCTLKYLGLANVRTSIKISTMLQRMLRKNTSLQVLDMRRNHLRGKGMVDRIIDIIVGNDTLLMFILPRYPFSEEMREDVENAASSNLVKIVWKDWFD
eukprot:TRINITY_DN3073_c0_g1_i2.p1 TRINITY_DN3073_c0_g1~~TRINITY_DN3073_c0_g1_i2.p1  ORF type:complete len:687 (-),score=164.70 TRINITY_DN3073_c0_g1_i2:723-2708(-)